MKILYVVTRSDEIGGAQIHVRDLAEAMNRRGHQALVAVGGDGPLFAQLEARGVPARRVGALIRAIRPWTDLVALVQLVRLFRAEKPDLVSLHSSKAGLLGRVAARIAGVPAVFTAHGWAFTEGVPNGRRRLYAGLERVAAHWARRIITVSEYDRRLALEAGVGHADQVVTVHNGMPEVAAELRAHPGDAPPHLIMVARFNTQKDHETLLRALADCRDLDWSLELIGAGPGQDAVEAQVENLGLGERVRFAGEVDDVAERLAVSQAFVLASRWEGLPRSIIEAMRAGLPVVASRVGGVAEQVADDVNGFLVAAGDVDALAGRLRVLLTDPALRQRLGEQGRRRFETEFGFAAMADHTETVYRAVLDRGG